MKALDDLNKCFQVKVSEDKLEAELWYNGLNHDLPNGEQWTEEDIVDFLRSNNVVYGLNHTIIKQLVNQESDLIFPLLIASGLPAINGEDGTISYHYDSTTEVDRSKEFDFREVMRIPTVQEGEEIARIIPPSEGKNGRLVDGRVIKAKPGRYPLLRAGMNVVYHQENDVFVAEVTGQVSIINDKLSVHDVYDVNEDISLQIGNIDFLGTVIIRGNVPTGYRIKASGDIKVYGIVEGAHLIAGGSVFVTEGLAGVRQGIIQAEADVYAGYINQGQVTAGGSIYIDRSVLHSDCTAGRTISCKYGNLIGGRLSAGESIRVKDAGNRSNTATEFFLGVAEELYDRKQALEKEQETEMANEEKLSFLKEKLEVEANLDAKTRITLLKVRRSLGQTCKKLQEIAAELESIDGSITAIDRSFVSVSGTVYPNVTVSFGKYRRTLEKKYDSVTIRMKNNIITII